jgi:hypothetical protein
MTGGTSLRVAPIHHSQNQLTGGTSWEVLVGLTGGTSWEVAPVWTRPSSTDGWHQFAPVCDAMAGLTGGTGWEALPFLGPCSSEGWHPFGLRGVTSSPTSQVGMTGDTSSVTHLKGGPSLGVRATSTDGWHRFDRPRDFN